MDGGFNSNMCQNNSGVICGRQGYSNDGWHTILQVSTLEKQIF